MFYYTAYSMLNKVHTIEDDIYYYEQQALIFEKYAAELMKIDLNTFRKETAFFSQIAKSIDATTSANELNIILKNAMRSLEISMSWESTHNNFDSFMEDKNAKMVFR